ncbi:hypothetical protein QA639_21355 [Bradyrhizobium pachyrhizi]|uniref:hypothetical protein n=1 Tax=Bradyrhizobium pachyrhizi TaxID=280333 RepID=UPI0024B22786|nr:hypothetical protein [Bradyrhizobium pachyrhizi]WFU52258.1 hypothetical protein QA639_21355 [Bradyrhizobium pachyrhizi]
MRRVPRSIPTLIVVRRDGIIESVGMRSLRIARAAARSFYVAGTCRAAFAMWR